MIAGRWSRFRASILDRQLRSLQITTNSWPFVRIEVGDDGVWGRPDEARYARARPDDPEVSRRILVSLGMAEPIAAKIATGWIPLSATNNPDLAAVRSVCRAALEEAGYGADPTPVGLGLIHYFNAGAYRSLWGYVILIHLGSVIGLDLMNSWLVMAESMAELDPGDGKWQSRVDQALAYFAGRTAGLAFLTPTEAKEVEPTARLGHVLAFVQRCFILLHEFGHVVHGHRTREGAASVRQEFEADAFAVRLLMEHGPSMARIPEVAPGWAPPAVAIGYLFAIRNAAETVHPTDHRQRTHPPAVDRWERVQAVGSAYPDWGEVVLPSVLPCPSRRGSEPGSELHGGIIDHGQ